MFENSKEIMRKIKNKEGLTDAEFTTVERCLLLGDVDDKILNYQLGVKIGVIDDLFHQDKMEFKNADKIMNQIRNKEELPKGGNRYECIRNRRHPWRPKKAEYRIVLRTKTVFW